MSLDVDINIKDKILKNIFVNLCQKIEKLTESHI